MNSFKTRLRTSLRRFLGVDSVENATHVQTRQIEHLSEIQTRLERLEHILYALEESHYRAIGEPRPRRDQIFVGGVDDFVEIGEEFFRYFRDLCHLRPDERVLDVGCGIGRMAVPLTKFLNADGGYEGFDIVAEGIDWCEANITARYPNFRFQLADVYNRYYHPEGAHLASQYRFPFDDASFDFVFLTSVFTHMLPADMENYLREIARVLKDGGRCLVTFFLWNAETAELLEAGRSSLNFSHAAEGYRLAYPDSPEAAVCYEESYVLELFRRYGLVCDLAVHYGAWSGRDTYLSGQDIIVAGKPGAQASSPAVTKTAESA